MKLLTNSHASLLRTILFVASVLVNPAALPVTVSKLYTFPNAPMASGGVVQAQDGNFYGAHLYGGDYGVGALFRVTPNGTFTYVVHFAGTNGANPVASPIQGRDLNLYGTTSGGGAYGYGTVFRSTTNGDLVTLSSFARTNGSNPQGRLIQGPDGAFYGTAQGGGSFSRGTVFKINPEGALSTLCSLDGTNGSSPYAGVILYNGDLYGCATSGGSSNKGTVFRATLSGSLNTVFSFSGTDGATPYGPLLLGNGSNLYGTTFAGGSNGYGTVFSLTPTGTLTTLVSFDISGVIQPFAGLIQTPEGDLYGTANGGGIGAAVFRLAANGVLTGFAGLGGDGPRDLILGTDGLIYGTIRQGGPSGYGAVFNVTSNGLYSIVAAIPFDKPLNPASPPFQASDGNWLGTTMGGGPQNAGTIYRFDPVTGFVQEIVGFALTNGTVPSGLVESGGGVFYGTTRLGGTGNFGTIFRFDTNSLITTLIAFDWSNGAYPVGCPVPDGSGNLYGSTYDGAPRFSSAHGSIFRLSASNTLTNLAYFYGTNGVYPNGLMLASDGNFYGTTYSGGLSNLGTVFRLSSAGLMSTLAHFQRTNGANPQGLTQGHDGILYGMTTSGGTAGNGTVFKLAADGSIVSLASFPGGTSPLQKPTGTMVEGAPGSFYGLTAGYMSGNPFFPGALFRFSTNGSITKLADVLNPGSGLTPANDGTLYGISTDPGAILQFCLQNIVSIKYTNSNILTTLSALPGETYTLQFSTNLTLGYWQSAVTNAADANGIAQFTDTNRVGGIGFYRTRWLR